MPISLQVQSSFKPLLTQGIIIPQYTQPLSTCLKISSITSMTLNSLYSLQLICLLLIRSYSLHRSLSPQLNQLINNRSTKLMRVYLCDCLFTCIKTPQNILKRRSMANRVINIHTQLTALSYSYIAYPKPGLVLSIPYHLQNLHINPAGGKE